MVRLTGQLVITGLLLYLCGCLHRQPTPAGNALLPDGEPDIGLVPSLAGAPVDRDYEPFIRDVAEGRRQLRGAMVLLGAAEGDFEQAVKDLRRLKSYGANHVRLYMNPTTGLLGTEIQRHRERLSGPDWWQVTGQYLKQRWLPVFAELDLPVILLLYLPEESTKDPRGAFWTDRGARERYAEYAVNMARLLQDEPAVIGYDLLNEPVPPGCVNEANGSYWWTWSVDRAREDVPDGDRVLSELYNTIITGIRRFDRHRLLVLEPGPWGLPWAFPALLEVQDDPRLVFSCHHYTPHALTHWGRDAWEKQDPSLLGPPDSRPCYPDPEKGWDRDLIAGMFETVEAFRGERERRTGKPCPVWIGEFGMWRWLDEQSLCAWFRDSLELMEERGYGMTQDGPEGEALEMHRYLAARREIDVGYFRQLRTHVRPSFEIVIEFMRRNREP
jgi:hypothetical protein